MTKIHAKKKNWARELAKGLISLKALHKEDFLKAKDLSTLENVKDNFDIRVPEKYVSEKKNYTSRVFKQFIPSSKESLFLPEELEDPISDEKYSPMEGLTHRYPDRVLLKPTYKCAVYCRFCFRRYKVSKSEFSFKENTFENAFQYIHNHKDIIEVILTGGDPLVLTDKKLFFILEKLQEIEHIKFIRIHTRIPSVLPSRINESFIEKVTSLKKTLWIVLHINSHEEFDKKTILAIKKLKAARIGLLMQSVLLKGVNDSSSLLKSLFYKAVENGIKPYYLHYLDPAQGTSHFRVPLTQAISLMETLRGNISGLCMPELIVDIPGGAGKIPIEPNWYQKDSDGTWHFRSPRDGKIYSFKYS